ncbi:TOMM precursor leader peptide-binding protein [uncultured Roseobacter sp.]|uniref:TOMM precursor leader peptide-binding protein n=1 Tax=uncultured Roseobacter sp. TaxID=114847 RepID=UPI00263538C5|nr:TOMM precursor leader peptide-binding protein [uncultured Roseobacter sp.]
MHLHPALDARRLTARAPSAFEEDPERGPEHGRRIMFRSATDSFAVQDNEALAAALRSGVLGPGTPGFAALKNRGALIETPLSWSEDMFVQSLDLARRAFQQVLGDDPERVDTQALAQPVLSVIGSGQVASRVAALCREAGLALADPAPGAEGADAAIVCADHWDHDGFSRQNERLSKTGLPYLFAYVDMTRAVAGPLCWGQDAACYACHFERRAAHGKAGRATEDWLTAQPDDTLTPPVARPSALVATAAATNAVALMIAHMSGMEHTAPLGTVREQEFLSGTFEAGIVLKAPRCAVCGTRPDFAPASPVRTGRLVWETHERDVND